MSQTQSEYKVLQMQRNGWQCNAETLVFPAVLMGGCQKMKPPPKVAERCIIIIPVIAMAGKKVEYQAIH